MGIKVIYDTETQNRIDMLKAQFDEYYKLLLDKYLYGVKPELLDIATLKINSDVGLIEFRKLIARAYELAVPVSVEFTDID